MYVRSCTLRTRSRYTVYGSTHRSHNSRKPFDGTGHISVDCGSARKPRPGLLSERAREQSRKSAYRRRPVNGSAAPPVCRYVRFDGWWRSGPNSPLIHAQNRAKRRTGTSGLWSVSSPNRVAADGSVRKLLITANISRQATG